MSDVNDQIPVATGKVEKVFIQPAQPVSNEESTTPVVAPKTDEELANEAKAQEEEKNKPKGIPDTKVASLESNKPLTDEELKAEYEKRFPTAAVLSAEDKVKAEEAFEKRMLDVYVEGGGKLEHFALLKQVASADLTELSISQLNSELKRAGFNDEEIKILQKERYYQLTEDDLEQLDTETEKEFAKRKAEYGKSKLENKASYQKNQAISFLNTLKETVKSRDLQLQQESDFSSNVDGHFDKLERKISLQLGKVNDAEVPPVEFEVPDSVIAEAKETLKDKAKRNDLLFNTDGSINLNNVADLVLKAKMFDSAVKTSYLEGGHRQVEILEKVLPYRGAHELGLKNGGSEADKTKAASVGKTQKMRPVNQN